MNGDELMTKDPGFQFDEEIESFCNMRKKVKCLQIFDFFYAPITFKGVFIIIPRNFVSNALCIFSLMKASSKIFFSLNSIISVLCTFYDKIRL